MNDRHIGRIEQPSPIATGQRGSVDPSPGAIQRAFARGFNQSAIPALLTSPRRNTSVGPCRVVGPDNHLAAITRASRICLDGGLRTKIGNSGVLHIRVLALVVTPHPHRTAGLLTRCINRSLIRQRHSIAQNIH